MKTAPLFIIVVFTAAFVFSFAPRADAHCDTMNGPVVAAARVALQAGDVTPVLKWIKKESEPELVAAFRQAVAVRKGGAQARALADRYFFETVVRLHRAGEGAPYTGLKGADTRVDPFVEHADAAIDKGSLTPLANHLATSITASLRTRYERVVAAKKRANVSVEAGREYVAAYVDYVHYVEHLSTVLGSAGHGDEPTHK